MAEQKSTKTKRIVMVKTTEPVQFFNVGGTQIAASMGGISLTWNGDVVVVTSRDFPGEEKWIFPATIAFIGWKEEV